MSNFRVLLAQNTTQPQQPIAPVTAPVQPFQTELISSITLFIATLCAIAVKEMIAPWLKTQRLKLSFDREQDQEIEQILITLLDRTSADRVILCRFTNGSYTIDGTSITGCTVTHEAEQFGLTEVSGLINSRIASYSTIIVRAFLEKSFIKVITDDIQNTSYRAFLEQLNIRFCANYFLAGQDLPLGFISFHWRSPNSRMDYEGISENEVRRYADSIISKLLSNQNVWAKVLTASVNRKNN
jgi:hypothetical protein